jgi:hypothetical protein
MKQMIKKLFVANKEAEVKQELLKLREEKAKLEKEKITFLTEREQMNKDLRLVRAETKAFEAMRNDFFNMMETFNEGEAMKKGAAADTLTKEDFIKSIKEEGKKALEAELKQTERFYIFARSIVEGYFLEEIELKQEALFVTNKSGKFNEYQTHSVVILAKLKNTNETVILLVDNINLSKLSYELIRFDFMEDWLKVKTLRGWV